MLFMSCVCHAFAKGLTSWLLFVMFIVFVTLPCGILGQVWYLVVSIPDLCRLSYFVTLLVDSEHRAFILNSVSILFPNSVSICLSQCIKDQASFE